MLVAGYVNDLYHLLLALTAKSGGRAARGGGGGDVGKNGLGKAICGGEDHVGSRRKISCFLGSRRNATRRFIYLMAVIF